MSPARTPVSCAKRARGRTVGAVTGQRRRLTCAAKLAKKYTGRPGTRTTATADRDRDLNDLDLYDLFPNNIMASPTDQTAPPTAPPATKTQQILAYEMLKLVTGELVKDSDIAKTAEGDA
eukprot:COSAG01_NODE_31832_length_590_cov_6.315682_1_plen_120_part_00